MSNPERVVMSLAESDELDNRSTRPITQARMLQMGEAVNASKLFHEVSECLCLSPTQAASVLGLHLARIDANPATFRELELLELADSLRRLIEVIVVAERRADNRAQLESLLAAARRTVG
jgi:hypothetical protein